MAEERRRAFDGIDAPNTTPVPDIYFDALFPELGKGSLKVLLYLTRRIFGFKKEGDTVSLSQICSGIRKRDGTVLDRGTGLSRQVAAAAVRELEELGVIVARRGLSKRGDPATTYYALRFREGLSVQDLMRGDPARPGYRFPGIDSPNTTPVPDVYIDLLLPELGLAEWRVLLYVVRRTLGFKKLSDAISLDQFTAGVARRDGTALDRGTGLSRSNVHEALNQLVMRNVLVRQRVHDERTGDGVSIFSLAMREGVRRAMGEGLGLAPGPMAATAGDRVLQPDHRGVLQPDHRGVLEAHHPGVPESDHPRVLEMDYQREEALQGKVGGVPEADHPGVLETDHPPVLQPDQPGSRKLTTGVLAPTLPVGAQGDPQETDLQETGIHERRRSRTRGYDGLLAQIAEDLGMGAPSHGHAERLAAIAEGSGLPAPDFLEAIGEAWRVTRARLRQGAIDHPQAALGYFLRVLEERAERAAPPQEPEPAGPDPSLQDARFVESVRAARGALGDQRAWLAVLERLAGTMTRTNYARWFARTACLEDGGGLLIVTADALQRDWLGSRLRASVEREAADTGERRPIRFAALADLHG